MSDNGGNYDCANYRNFAESWAFEYVTSSPHYSQSNGFIERSIQTVKLPLKKAKESNMDSSKAILCLRSTPLDYHIPYVTQRIAVCTKAEGRSTHTDSQPIDASGRDPEQIE